MSSAPTFMRYSVKQLECGMLSDHIENRFLRSERPTECSVRERPGLLLIWPEREHLRHFIGVPPGLLPVVDETSFATDDVPRPD